MSIITQEFDERSNAEKPKTTWQQYDPKTNILIVRVSDDPMSEVYYEGEPSGYNGKATQEIE